MSSFSSFSSEMDAEMNLTESIDAFDWLEDIAQGVDEGDRKELASEERSCTLDNPKSGSNVHNYGIEPPSDRASFSESQNEFRQIYQEYQKQVDLEILYQRAMIAHLQSKQISERSQAAFTDISAFGVQAKEQQQQESQWHCERHPQSTFHEQHQREPKDIHGSVQDVTSYPPFDKELYKKNHEREQKRQEWNQYSPKNKQGKRASVSCMASIQKRRFALSSLDQSSELPPSHAKCLKSNSAGAAMLQKDSSQVIKDLQRGRQSRSKSCTEMKGEFLSEPKQEHQYREKSTSNGEEILGTDDLERSNEQLQDTYAENEREILQLLLEDDQNEDGKLLKNTNQMDKLELQFKRALIAHHESKQKSKQTFFFTNPSPLQHQESLKKYKTSPHFQTLHEEEQLHGSHVTDVKSMQQVNVKSKFEGNNAYQDAVEVTALQSLGAAGVLPHVEPLRLSRSWDHRECFNIDKARIGGQQQDCLNKGEQYEEKIQLAQETLLPLGRQVLPQQRKITSESVRAVEALISGRASSLTKELEQSRRWLREFFSQKK